MVKVFKVCLEPSSSPKGYLTGCKVAGKVVVVTDEDKSYRQIEVSFVGSGKVEWTEGSGEDSDTHKAKEEYLNESVTLWDDGQEEVLPAGRHEFPFAFSVPESCPPSYETARGSSSLDAWVRYVITGRISTRGALKADHATENRITVVQGRHRHINSRATADPVRLQDQGTVGCLCCASGPVALSIELPRSVFTAGKAIPLIADLENGTAHGVRVEATLVKRVKLKAHGHVLRKPAQPVVQASSEPFRARSTATWNTELPAIPDTHATLETPGGMIAISYELKVHVGLGLGQKLEASTPIIIERASVDNGVGYVLPKSMAGRVVATDQYQPWTN